MNAAALTQELLEGRPKSAKHFIMHQAQPPPLVFDKLTRDCFKYGELDDDAVPELQQALILKRPFDTEWLSDRKEIESYRIERKEDGTLVLKCSAEMDEPHDLIDTAVWEAYGKNKYAGSGYEAGMKKWKFAPGGEDDLSKQCLHWMYVMADESGIDTHHTETISFPPGDQHQDDADRVLMTLQELSALCSGALEKEYRRLITYVRKNGREVAQAIKDGTIQYHAGWGGMFGGDPLGMPGNEDDEMEESAAGLMVRRLLEGEYSYSTTQLNLPSPLNDFVVKWGRMNVTDDMLYYEDDGGMGRETEPHITVLYGLLEKEPSPALLDLIDRTKPFTVRLGPLSLFESEKYDVLKFEVISDELVQLSNAIRAACPNENQYPKYIPHCTVAYCKKGTVANLEGHYPFEASPPIPNEFEAAELVFSGAGSSDDVDRVKRVLPFNRLRKEAKEFIKSLTPPIEWVESLHGNGYFGYDPLVPKPHNAEMFVRKVALMKWKVDHVRGLYRAQLVDHPVFDTKERAMREAEHLYRYHQARRQQESRAKAFIQGLGPKKLLYVITGTNEFGEPEYYGPDGFDRSKEKATIYSQVDGDAEIEAMRDSGYIWANGLQGVVLELISSEKPNVVEAKEQITGFYRQAQAQEISGDLDRAIRNSIGQALEFRLVPVGATFVHNGKIMTRNDSDNWGWDFFRGGYTAIGDNEVVKPVHGTFSPYDNLPFPAEVAVLRQKLRQR